MKTQEDLEARFYDISARVKAEGLNEEIAFGPVSDWLLPLGDQEAFLNPRLKQWMWHDRLHNELVLAGCGIRQGILIVLGKTAGVKLLPTEDKVGNWCVVKSEDQLLGPLLLIDLLKEISSGSISTTAQVWSPCFSSWISSDDPRIQELLK